MGDKAQTRVGRNDNTKKQKPSQAGKRKAAGKEDAGGGLQITTLRDVSRILCNVPWRLSFRMFVLSVSLWLIGIVAALFLEAQGSGAVNIALTFHNALYHSDGAWYYSVAVNGYTHRPFTTDQQYNWAFFPLYPYLTKVIAEVTNISILRVGYILSTVSYFVSFPLLWILVVSSTKSEETAESALLWLAVSPMLSYFLAYRAAALYFALSLGSLVAMSRHNWGWASAFGACASLARPTGILLMVPFLLYVWRRPNTSAVATKSKLVWSLLGLLFALGPIVLSIVDWRVTGNPLAFSAIQAAWSRNIVVPFSAALSWFVHPALGLGSWSIEPLSVLFAIAGVPVGIMLLKKAPDLAPLSWYLIASSVLFNLFNGIYAMPRYVLEVPTTYLAVAVLVRRNSTERMAVALSVAVAVVFVALATLGVYAAQA